MSGLSTTEQALALEREEALEISIERDERRFAVGPKQPHEKKKFVHVLRQEALTRLEDAARTPEDFATVTAHWDHRDENAARRVRYHEVGRGDIPIEYGRKRGGRVFPAYLGLPRWKQVMHGEFLDVIFDCPYDIHEIPTYAHTSIILNEALSERQKELLYYLTVCGMTATKAAVFLNVTDRNIRKRRVAMLEKLERQLLDWAIYKADHEMPLCFREKELIHRHFPAMKLKAWERKKQEDFRQMEKYKTPKIYIEFHYKRSNKERPHE